MKNNKTIIILGTIILILLAISQLLPYFIKDNQNHDFLLPETGDVINPYDQRAYVHINNLQVTVKSHGIVESDVFEVFDCETCLASDINVAIGDYVSKEDILFNDTRSSFKGKVMNVEYDELNSKYTVVLKNLEKRSVSFYINQIDTEKIKLNQETIIYYNDLVFDGKITSIAEEFSNGQLLIKASINDDQQIIRPNAFVNVSVNVYTKKDVLVLSKYAVYYQNNKAYVNVLIKDEEELERIVPTEIVTGVEGDIFVQIIAGVKKGDLIVYSINNDSYD
jgi:hypothetical protein